MASRGYKSVAIWDKPKDAVAEYVVHYRQKHVLQKMRVMQGRMTKEAEEALHELMAAQQARCRG